MKQNSEHITDWEQYRELAQKTATITHDTEDKLINGMLGLIGEAGEVVDAIKKWAYQSGNDMELPEEVILKECGDVLWYIAEFATAFGIPMKKIFDGAINKPPVCAPEDCTPKNRDFVDEICDCAKDMAIRAACAVMYADAINSDETVTLLLKSVCRDLDCLLQYCGYSLMEAAEANIEKLRKRYPEGFDPERSLHRAADDK